MSNDTTSSGTGATPTPDTAVTATPGPASETQQKPALSLEEAMKRIAELEHSYKNADEERTRHRKKLSAYEDAEKKAQEAQLSEVERVNKQNSELQHKLETTERVMRERIIRYEVEAQAHKLGIIDPEAAAKLLDWSEIQLNDDGIPSNAANLLEKLIKHKPYLAPKPAEPAPAATPAQTATTQRAPAVPAMNPGRSNITAPNTPPPGRIPRLSDPGVLVPPGTVSKYQP